MTARPEELFRPYDRTRAAARKATADLARARRRALAYRSHPAWNAWHVNACLLCQARGDEWVAAYVEQWGPRRA